MRNHARILAVALALSASGCSLMVDPAKNDPLETAEGFCNSIQDVISKLDCGVYYQTGGSVDPTALDQVLTSLRSGCDNLKTAVSGGRFTYDASAARGCIDALESVGCKGIFAGMGGPALPTACTRAVKGNVAPGGACYDWDGQQGGTGVTLNECTQGSSCRYNDFNVCQSTCAFDSDVGEACGRGNRYCKSNLYCNYSDYKCYAYVYPNGACDHSAYRFCDPSSSYCTAATGPGTCAYLPSSGAACRTTGSSIWGYTCNSSSYCNAGTCTYKPYPGSGTTCTSAPCQEGSYCDGTWCKNYVAEGGSCGAGGGQCAYPPNGTSVPLYCDLGGTCRRYPATRLGQGGDCYNLGSSYCADGLFCDYGNVLGLGANTCQPQQTSGLCTIYEMCAPGTECRYDSALAKSYCVPLGRLGAACDSTSLACLPGTWCKTPNVTTTAGTCSLLPGAGQACASGSMQACAFGTRPDGTPCTCRPFFGEGEACSGDWECGGTMTGRKCVSGSCQPYPCFTPIGWLAGTSGGT